jgi:hypothetical protein
MRKRVPRGPFAILLVSSTLLWAVASAFTAGAATIISSEAQDPSPSARATFPRHLVGNVSAVAVGLGRIVALHRRSFPLYHIR